MKLCFESLLSFQTLAKPGSFLLYRSCMFLDPLSCICIELKNESVQKFVKKVQMVSTNATKLVPDPFEI